MEKDLKHDLEQLEEIAKTVDLPKTIKYLCVCPVSVMQRKNEMEKPNFMRSKSAMIVNIWLMPDFAVGLKNREILEKKRKEINEILGDMYHVDVCPTMNDILFRKGFYVEILKNKN